MRILPYATFTVETDATPPELVERLEASIERDKFFFRGWRSDKPFVGIVDLCTFKIHRLISSLNSFQPIMHGTLEPRNGGTDVVVDMKLPAFAYCFSLCWAFFWGSLFISGIFKVIREGEKDLMYVWIPAVMLAFMWILAHVCFWPEYFISKRKLLKVLRGE